MAALDHLVYGSPDLDATVADLAAQLGIQPVAGGSHPGRGTSNALLSLGPRRYLEIIGPDPDQPDPDSPRPFGIDDLTAPTLITWAMGADNLGAALAEARKNGYEPGEPRGWPPDATCPYLATAAAMSRQRTGCMATGCLAARH